MVTGAAVGRVLYVQTDLFGREWPQVLVPAVAQRKRAPTTIVTKTVASLVSPNDEQCFVVPPEIRRGKLKARRHEHPGYWNVE